jgi:hypothetical protein
MRIRHLGLLLIPALLASCSNSQPNSIATSTTSPANPSEVPTMGSLEPKAVIGMTEAEAVQTIEGVSSEKLSVRIARRDSENFVLTMDYSPSRINLEIDHNLVSKATIG